MHEQSPMASSETRSRNNRSPRDQVAEVRTPRSYPRTTDVCTPWIPESALRPLQKESINSIVRETLLATPEFPRLYADMVLATRPNSHEAKILRPQYQKILEVRSTQAYRSILSVIGILQQCPLVSCHNFQSSSLNPRARGLSSIP
jgi:hypothetical protein